MQSLHQRFEAQASQRPDAIALEFEGSTLTYLQLNRRANILAHRLRDMGVGPDRTVVLMFDRGIELIVAVLAVLKAGGAYVPIDPAYPAERVTFMLGDSVAKVALVQQGLETRLGNSRLPTIVLNAGGSSGVETMGPDADPVVPDLGPGHLAYVIYTSGSTGRPKGVLNQHAGLINLLPQLVEQFHIDAASKVLQFASPSFDASVLEIAMALCFGATLCLARREAMLPGEPLLATLKKHQITHLTLPPSALSVLPSDAELPTVKTLTVAGEACSPALVRRWAGRHRMINIYGPTETTIYVTAHHCQPDQMGSTPIGRPVRNVPIYILDEHLRRVEQGHAGEIYVAGPAVARGYLDRDVLTAERFLIDAFGAVAEARMYKTGDLGRYLPDGSTEYLGRLDHQVKLRGFRIELGEIEAKLAECEAVREAVVSVHEDSRGDRRLVAYYTTAVASATAPHSQLATLPNAESLRSRLAAQLPDFMVPSAFVRLPAMPLTPNGKIDRKALPAPDDQSFIRRDYEAPVGEWETTLAQVWTEVLGLPRIGRRDHFFELGGHSLTVVRVASRLQARLGIELDLAELFNKPELSVLAQGLERATRSELPHIKAVARGQPLALSFAQQRLWFLSQLKGVSRAYHIHKALRLKGNLNPQVLQRTLDRILARHEALRTTFVAMDGEPTQRIGPPGTAFALHHHDVRGRVHAAQDLQDLSEQEIDAAFDLERGPLIRGRLIQLGEAEHVLLLTMHHIVSDGWSMEVLGRELTWLYEAFCQGRGDPAPALPIQYADFAAWQRRWLSGPMMQAQGEYWTRTLKGAPELLELPTDRTRPQRQDHAGGQVAFAFDEKLSAGLKALGQRHGATLFMTLLAAWGAVLTRLSGQAEVLIGTPVANRRRTELEGLIGFFVNTLVLRLDSAGGPTVGQWLERVRAQVVSAQQHQDLPFEQVVELMCPVRSASHNPLFQVMLAWEGEVALLPTLPGLEVQELRPPQSMAKFDLTLTLREQGGHIEGEMVYATALFDRDTICRHIEYLRCIAEAMLADGPQEIGQLNVLPDGERRRLLMEWNDTRVEFPDQRCVHEMFEAQVQRGPQAVALRYGERQLTYGDLNGKSNQLAHYLIAMGVEPDERVAMLLERGAEVVVAMLAILKAGAAYVPLDPEYPAQRLAYMIKDCAPRVLLVEAELWGKVRQALGPNTPPGLRVLEWNGAIADWADESTSNPVSGKQGLSAAHLAYVIYTSGSTGQPKGVMVEHGQLANYVNAITKVLDLPAGSHFATVSTFAADLGNTAIFPALCGGGVLHVVNRQTAMDGALLAAYMERERIDLLKIVPAHLDALIQTTEHPQRLVPTKRLVLGGEPCTWSLVDRVQALKPDCLIFNHYGPTETTVGVSTLRLSGVGKRLTDTPPVGRPLANVTLQVLDEQLALRPIGSFGELCVGGLQVSRGYLNSGAETARRFIASPYGGGRLYRTGDKARVLPDGTVQLMGRLDNQVKIRGFRIEPGEVESKLRECEGIGEAVVLAQGESPADKRLVAYYTARVEPAGTGSTEDSVLPSPDVLRVRLAAQLPDYMVPAAFVLLRAMPLTSNGKLDTKALPSPDASAFASRGYEAPLGEIETTLAQIWSEVLGLPRIGRHDHFFELGGHSLLAVRVASRVHGRLGLELELADLFHKPELSALALALQEAARSEVPHIEPVARDQPLALSFAQQRLWFLSQMEGASEAYNVARGLRISGPLDSVALHRALDALIARHEALRTSFVAVDGLPVLHIASPGIEFALRRHDLRGQADADGELQRLVETEAIASFDLEAGPLMRGRLIRVGQDEHLLLLTMHHIVSDAWSKEVLARDLAALYRASVLGQDQQLPALQIQYADFAAWQRRWLRDGVLQAQTGYWQQTLAGAPALIELPTDRVRPQRQDYSGALVEFSFDAALSAGLRALGQRHGSTLFMTLMAAWAAVLLRLSGQNEVVIGTPVANRRHLELEPLIGFFVNTLALRLDSAASANVKEWLEHVKTQVIGAQQHQDLPFEQVVELLRPLRSMAHSPLFQVMFVWEGQVAPLPEWPGLAVEEFAIPQTTAKFDLTLFLRERQGQICGSMEFATALFDRETIARHIEYLRCIATAMLADERQSIERLNILPEAERHKLLVQWNDTKLEFPDQRGVHELFEAQVERDPNAVAVRQGGQGISYSELNVRANRLAHHLRGLGVGHGDFVAVVLERSVQLIVAQLAILKCGAAYVPLDASAPAQRLVFMLKDCRCRVWVTGAAPSVLAPGDIARVDVEQAWPAGHAVHNLALQVGSDAPAYAMYTSGSTGEPKGVVIPHRAIARLVFNNGYARFEATDRVAFAANPAFDASTLEVWAPLLNGGCVVVIEAETLLAPDRFSQSLLAEQVDFLWLTVGLFNQYADDLTEVLPRLRYLIVGGDVLDPQVIDRVLRKGGPQHLLNGYGPTETTTFATTFEIAAAANGLRNIPIGRPIANTRVYILDRWRQPVPTGATGELYISGAGLATGYLNRPDLSAERFVLDPFGDAANARMYRTGDLARYRVDGNIEFLGRNDTQVKLRGFRIELGEIEAKLGACEGVHEAVVLAREDIPGDKRLIAYYTIKGKADKLDQGRGPEPRDAEALRTQLTAQLPDYMVPTAFVRLPALPLTPNGKVDRRALPAPDVKAFATKEFEPPTGEIETVLARIWSDVLSIATIGRHDNFFELGGHSLKATQVVSRLRRDLGVVQPVRAVFEQPTLAGLATLLRIAMNDGIARAPDAAPPRRPGSRDVPLPTSFSQRRMWLVQQLNPKTAAYNISLTLHLAGGLSVEALCEALRVVVQRHEAFRTRFIAQEGEPRQLIADELALKLESIDLSHAPQEVRQQLARECVSDIISRPYDLSAPGLYRIALLHLGEQEHVLLWNMHHVIGDQWSFGILLRELRQVYGSLVQGQVAVLTPLDLDYSDHASWQRERAGAPELRQQLEYWRKQLSGVKPIALPTDFPRYGPLEGQGGGVQLQLAPALIERIRQFSRKHAATPFMTLLACFQVLMARISGQGDIAVAAPIANRLGIHTESLVGTLVNTLVLRSELSGDPSFVDLLKKVQETALQAYAHQDTSFEQLVEVQEAQRDSLRAPLAQVMFNLVNAPFSLNGFPNLTVTPFEFEKRGAQFELSVGVDLEAFGQVHLGYASELYSRATAQRLLASYMTLVQAVVVDPSRRLSEYDLLGDSHRRELALWNQTDARALPWRNLAQMLCALAPAQAASVALRDSDGALNYAELDARSNRLARALKARGMSRGALVGLCVERSSAMVVAQLAILKAGAAYVPLDPAYPPDRLALMAEDAQLALLVTESAQMHALRWPRANSLWLDGDAPSIAAHDDSALPADAARDAGPEDPAYVIFTSGSTGRPKGVVVPQRAVMNFLASMAHEPGLAASDRLLAVTTLSFDIAVLELLLPLSVGATVVLASADQALDGRALKDCIEQHGVTVMQATPSTWRMLLEAGWQGKAGFKALIGGEALPADLAHAMLARVGELWNMYGPTETTVWSTCWRVVSPQAGICIGRPIANTQVHVLDANGQQCLIGVPGEIYIGGEGVALGYLHRAELTEERFVPDRFGGKSHTRLYRTGDLGRWRYDGQLEHMGRLDHQVKIRGHRIELGEIEANLASHPGVARAVVIVREDRPGDMRISAYLVPRAAMPAAAELRDHLRSVLPQYMLPQHYVALEAIPLLPNGKLDRALLPAPQDAASEPRAARVPLSTPNERAIAEVWQRLLELDEVLHEDNFFDLGGHSLLAVRAVTEIESAIGLHLSPRRLIFETLAQLAVAPAATATATANQLAAQAKASGSHQAAAVPTFGNKFFGGIKRLMGDQKK